MSFVCNVACRHMGNHMCRILLEVHADAQSIASIRSRFSRKCRQHATLLQLQQHK